MDGVTFDSSVFELVVLNSLIFHATLLKKEIDLELAKEVLKNIIKEIQSDVSVDFIQKTVSEYFKTVLTKILQNAFLSEPHL